MKVLLAGGGTAGHINPALAIAGVVRLHDPAAPVLYVGAKGGMEERLVPAAGYDFKGITVSGFQRRLTLKNIGRNVKTVMNLVTSSRESRRILREFQPDLCVGTGGYVSGPILREAAAMGIPILVHEQNAFPGVANKMLSKRAQRTMLTVADAQKYLDASARCVVTGLPVRQAVANARRDTARQALGLDDRPLIVSFGGSLGAKSINDAMLDILLQSAKSGKYQHIHGSGRRYHTEYVKALSEKGFSAQGHPHIRVSEYLDQIPECLAAADLVICRAGASTLSELEAVGRASILIPSPNVAENHQFYNAMALVNRNAAVILEEKDLSGETLSQKVEELFSQPHILSDLGRNAKKMAVLDADERIYRLMQEVLAHHSRT